MKEILGFSLRGRGVLIASLALAGLPSAFSQSLDPIFSAQSGNWSEITSWSLNEVPGAEHYAIIGGGTHSVVVNSLVDPIGKLLIGHDMGSNDGDGELTIGWQGELSVSSDVLINSSASDARQGTLTVERGDIKIGGDLIFGVGGNAGGEVNAQSGSLDASNILKTEGTDGARLHIDGATVSVSGEINFRDIGASDEIVITGGGLRFTDPSSPGVMDSAAAQSLKWSGGVIQGLETFDGDLIQEGGILAPGIRADLSSNRIDVLVDSAPGVITITGDYRLNDSSMIDLTFGHWNGVGDPTAGIDYDQIVVGGEFDAGGASIAIVGRAGPVGSKFIVVAGSSPPVGQFIQGTEVRSYDYHEYAIDYGGASGNDIELTYLGHYLDRDYDGDGLSNFHEIVFGTDINDPSDVHKGTPEISVSGNVATIRFLQMEFPAVARNFVGYEVMESTDNSTWIPAWYSSAPSTDQSGAPSGYNFWEMTIPVVTGERRFFKVTAFAD